MNLVSLLIFVAVIVLTKWRSALMNNVTASPIICVLFSAVLVL